MTTTTHKQPELTAASQASQFLADWLAAPDLATLEQVEPAFALLAVAIEALPPTIADTGMMCWLRNALTSAQADYARGEWGAAGYLFRQMHRRLARTLAGTIERHDRTAAKVRVKRLMNLIGTTADRI